MDYANHHCLHGLIEAEKSGDLRPLLLKGYIYQDWNVVNMFRQVVAFNHQLTVKNVIFNINA
jgi:hypothetical protein